MQLGQLAVGHVDHRVARIGEQSDDLEMYL
jgi:hypothetical protein